MRTILNLNDMQEINKILSQSSSASSFVNKWEINIPGDLNFRNQPRVNPELEKSNEFVHDFFIYYNYKQDKLSAYKKVFDFCFKNNIDLLTCFDNAVYKSLAGSPDLFDLFSYAYENKYFKPNHDFSIYFNKLQQPTRQTLIEEMKLLPALDDSQKSFLIYTQLFDNYLTLVNNIGLPEQEKIKNLFQRFEHQPFFHEYHDFHEKFYPGLLKVGQLSDLQEDDYYSKRFCLGSYHKISTLSKNIENNLNFIYNVVLNNVKEKDLLSDFYTFKEQGSFYLYVFTETPEQLQLVGKTIKSFHNEIQGFLQNNTETEDYYIKLFNTISLAEKLANKPREKTEQIIVKQSSIRKI